MCAEQHAFRASEGAPDAPQDRAGDESLGRVLALVRVLRSRCPWDARQTPASLRPYLLEESHEVAEAIARGDDGELRRELGDLLLNVAFQIVLAEERAAFGAADVVTELEEKMQRRHPHVYGDASEAPEWEALKAEERIRASASDPRPAGGRAEDGPDPFHGVASGLDPLSRAARFQERAAGLNFDWPDAAGALGKLREETDELARLLARSKPRRPPGRPLPAEPAVEEEVGDLLFAAVNVARLAGAHPAVALERAIGKFAARFRRVLALAREAGLDPKEATLAALDALWERAKAEEPPAG